MKATISQEQYNLFKEYINDREKVEELNDSMRKEYYGRWNEPAVREISDLYEKMFNLEWASSNYKYMPNKEIFKKLDILMQFTALKERAWEVSEEGSFWCITFSGHSYFYLPDYATVVEEPDYENLSIADMKRMITAKKSCENLSFLPNKISSLTVADAKKNIADIEDKKKELDKLKEDITHNREESLAALEEEMNKIKEQLEVKKKELMAEMEAKLSELEEKKKEMIRDITILESEIYTIRSYSGETVELTKVRNGRPADSSSPVIINQKMLYLDEDLARIMSIYQDEISEKYSMFEDVLKYSDDIFEAFCPQERCVTFFRLSKNATYEKFNDSYNMYEREALLHGKKIGFAVRDGENAFIGWLDESWGIDHAGKPRLVSFTDNLIYKPEEETVINHVDDATRLSSDSSNTMVSRVFAMAALQGIFDNGNIMSFPEKVNIMKPSRYIIYNFADAWLMDDRFGSFDILTKNLRKYTRVKDTVLLIFDISGGSGRSMGEADRTYDCELEEGVYELNVIKDGYYYIRARRRHHKTCSNVAVRSDELINLSYMNSIWLRYYIQTKKLGAYSHDYAKSIKHFKKSLEIIEAREAEEIKLIKAYYPEADQVAEWQLKLSHWKLKNGIRRITEFQAKRVAAYLESGKFYEMVNLFEEEPEHGFSINRIYSLNNLQKSICSYINNFNTSDIEFGLGKMDERNFDSFYHPDKYPYANEKFYCTAHDESWSDSEKKKKEKAEKKAAAYEEIFKKVPARIKKDEEKLNRIREQVMEYLQGHDITAMELSENDNDGYIFKNDFIACDKHIGYVKSSSLSEDQISVIRHGNIYGIEAGYANKFTCDGPLWPLYYHNHLQECYEKMLEISRKILHDRWMKETRDI